MTDKMNRLSQITGDISSGLKNLLKIAAILILLMVSGAHMQAQNLTISTAASGSYNTTSLAETVTISNNSSSDVNINVSDISNFLNEGKSVIIQSSGKIIIQSNITSNNGGSVTFSGEVAFSNTSGVIIAATNANITFEGAVDSDEGSSPSPLTINAGTGTVTFKDAVGNTKALQSLTVTAATTAINGGSITTNADGTHGGSGAQSYSGNITLGSANTTLWMLDTPTDFTLNSSTILSNSSGVDATLTIKTTAGIVLAEGSKISSTTGKLNTIFWADSDASYGGGIHIKSGASINSNGGNVTLSGGTDYTSGHAKGTSATEWSGIRLDGSISSGAGSVLLRGEMGAIPANQNTLSPGGVHIIPSGSITATSGNITLIGSVSGDVGTGNALRAIRLGDGIASSGQASLATTSGDISLSGTTVPTYAGAGILFDSSKIQSGTGSITFAGQQGSGEADLLFNSGTSSKNISNQISSTTGNIIFKGNTLAVWGEGELYARLSISGEGQLAIHPRTATTTIGIAGVEGTTLQLPSDLFSTSFADGFSGITIGGSSQSGTISLNTVTFRDNTSLQTTGTVNVNSNQTITTQKNKLQIGNKLDMGAGAKIIEMNKTD